MAAHTLRRGTSAYKKPFPDPKAVFFTPELFPVLADPNADVSDTLQRILNEIKREHEYGILYIPEGVYRLEHTVLIPRAVRLIGCGRNRPRFVLPPNAPDFRQPAPYDLGGAHYMFWFVGNNPTVPEEAMDANPGTFYSAVSNIDFEIGEGNPHAAVIRAHFAQHCFISHCDFHIGSGYAGIVEVGNEMENLFFEGGDYGIVSSKPSPGWPFFMADSTFTGQRKAAIRSQEGGFVLARTEISRCPTAVDCAENFWDKLYIEDSRFIDISEAAVKIPLENNASTQINLRRTACSNVPVLALLKESGKTVEPGHGIYMIDSYTHGVCMDSPEALPELRDELVCRPLDTLPEPAESDLLPLPGEWVSVKTFGAVGDGVTDDTEALRAAAASGKAVFFPQGLYRTEETVTLADGTAFIGMNPVSTRLMLADDAPAFSGSGIPKALLESSAGTNIVNGLAIDTAGRNPRAAGCKWVAANGYVNDVKFYGGHGSMIPGVARVPTYNETRTADANPDYLWDSQFWSLWITDNAGGVFKDVWSASPYAEAGVYLSDTSNPGRMYCVSVEHHVRAEIKMKNVSNWRFYAMQTEAEVAESSHCQPIELIDCKDLLFAGVYTFRVVWVEKPHPQAILSWGSRNLEMLNLHNYTQSAYAFDDLLLEKDSGVTVRPWELASLLLPGPEKAPAEGEGKIRKLVGGLSFAGSVCADSKGTLYFCDDQGVYSLEPETGKVRPVMKLHLQPVALCCDTRDNLVVTALRRLPRCEQPDFRKPFPLAPDAKGSSYHGYMRNRVVCAYVCDPRSPEATMTALEPAGLPAAFDVVYYPAHMWQDEHDYLTAVQYGPEEFYVAPDGRTTVAASRNLMRAVCMNAARPGQAYYGVNEYDKRVYRLQVDEKGRLSDPKLFCEQGEFAAAAGNGKVYVADALVYEYDEAGALLRRFVLPDRPTGLLLSADGKTLYVAARVALYAVDLQ